MKISVTAEHIKNGKREHCFECPVALAFKDIYDKTVYVNGYLVKVPNVDDYIELPEEVTESIFFFDTMNRMLPFTFEMDIPAP